VFDSVGDEKPRTRKRKRDDEYSLNPTQAVVISIFKQLPDVTCHVFLDNLFSSPNLFIVLRDMKVGATGTCRTSIGIFKLLTDHKKAGNNGELKWK
jgi:hypothetical protein